MAVSAEVSHTTAVEEIDFADVQAAFERVSVAPRMDRQVTDRITQLLAAAQVNGHITVGMDPSGIASVIELGAHARQPGQFTHRIRVPLIEINPAAAQLEWWNHKKRSGDANVHVIDGLGDYSFRKVREYQIRTEYRFPLGGAQTGNITCVEVSRAMTPNPWFEGPHEFQVVAEIHYHRRIGTRNLFVPNTSLRLYYEPHLRQDRIRLRVAPIHFRVINLENPSPDVELTQLNGNTTVTTRFGFVKLPANLDTRRLYNPQLALTR